jgi:arylformamidase
MREDFTKEEMCSKRVMERSYLAMYKIYDISVPIYCGMPVYKNKPEKQPHLETVSNGYVSETRLSLDVHTGTHVDAPLHMIIQGDTMESIPLEHLVGQCRVFDLTHAEEAITLQDIEHLSDIEGEFILLKTRNSQDQIFNPDFIYLKEDAALFLVEQKVRGVGIDSLGIERSQPGHPTHKALFGSNIIIIEGLQLSDVPEGVYFMVAAPLKLQGTDAAPARVILIEGIPA